MRCVAGVHYEVARRQERYRGKYTESGDIRALFCNFCSFAVYKTLTGKPRSSKSGLGRYNRMRGEMVKHLHEQHREQLAAEPKVVGEAQEKGRMNR